MPTSTTLNKAEGSNEFHKLLVFHLPMLRQQALSLTRHKADAEDLLQAAVTSAIAAQDGFLVGTNFKAWISCILRNRFLSNLRQRRFHMDLGDVPEAMLGRQGGQDDNLEIIELRRQMSRLPADQRLILIMIAIEGISYDDASIQLGVAVGTLKCRVFRARAQLQIWMHGREGTAHKIIPSKTARAAAPTQPRRIRTEAEQAMVA